jgi:hypothetical protein
MDEHERTNTTRSHSYVDYKKVELIEVESRMVVRRD